MRIGIAVVVGGLACVGCDSSNSSPFGAAGGGVASTAGSAGVNAFAGANSGTGINSNGGTGASTDPIGNPAAGSGNVSTAPGPYALGAPDQCTNDQSVDNCTQGNTASACGGVCSGNYGSGAQSACESGKSGVPITFACPRFLAFSDQFTQAAIDDGNTAFNYGIVGHDYDPSGVDSGLPDACCQCYQIIFDYPKENQVWVDPNTTGTPVSAVPPPKPMIVQSFNTGTAGPGNFDIYMGAGGLGANNGCFSIGSSVSKAGLYQYTGYPPYGQPGDGGVKPAGNWGNGSACKNSYSWVTAETISSAACVQKVTDACNEILATDPKQQAAARRSCIQSNDVDSLYHLNWYFRVKRVECPEHLAQVTGCKLAPQGLPSVDSAVTTVAQSEAAGFRKTDGTGAQYHTTSMEDCCMPTCAWRDNVKGATVDGYNSFYSCNQGGYPLTEEGTAAVQ